MNMNWAEAVQTAEDRVLWRSWVTYIARCAKGTITGIVGRYLSVLFNHCCKYTVAVEIMLSNTTQAP